MDLAPYLAPNSQQAYMLNSGELCQSVQDGKGYTRFLKNAHYETLWFDDQSIFRGLDTSNLPNEVYAQFTGERYGAVWCKRHMNIGDVTERNPDIRYYDANGQFLRSAPGGVSYLRLMNHYPSYTYSQTGKTVNDVIELTWELDREGKQIIEYYHYAKGMGLVAFEYTGTPRFTSYYSGLTSAHPTFAPLPNFAEPAPPPVSIASSPNYPAGMNPAAVLVNQTAGLKLRPNPTTAQKELRIMAYREQVTRYAEPVVSADGYTWVRVTDGMGSSGWAADPISGVVSFIPATIPDTWTVKLDVPYVSQINAAADISANDCGVASLLMQVRYWFTQHGLSVPSVPAVDDLVSYTALVQNPPPKGLTFAQLEQLAAKLGFKTLYQQPMAADAIATFLREGKPAMVLVDYLKYAPSANSQIAHLCIVSGYNSTSFLTQDPYLMGANYKVSRQQLEDAMRSSPGNTVGFQGMVLAV